MSAISDLLRISYPSLLYGFLTQSRKNIPGIALCTALWLTLNRLMLPIVSGHVSNRFRLPNINWINLKECNNLICGCLYISKSKWRHPFGIMVILHRNVVWLSCVLRTRTVAVCATCATPYLRQRTPRTHSLSFHKNTRKSPGKYFKEGFRSNKPNLIKN